MDKQETERLVFSQIDIAHFDHWLEFFKDPTSFEHWICELKAPEIECESWYKNQFNRYNNLSGGMNALFEKQTGKLIGHCGLLVQHVDDNTELEIAYSLYKKVTMLPKPDNEKRVMNYGVKFIHLNRALKLDKAFNVITRLNFDYGKRYGSIYFFCGLSFNYFLYEPQDADVYNIRSIKLPGGRVKHLNSDYWPGYNVGVQLL